MQGQGWIKLYRKITDSPVFYDLQMKHLWLICLLKASYKPHEVVVGRQKIYLNPGEFVTGREALTDEYNRGLTGRNRLSSSTVWRMIKTLETWGNLNIKSHSKYSVISIANWSLYQEEEQQLEHQNEQEMNSKCTSIEQQVNTNKKGKNVENDKTVKKDNKKTLSDSNSESSSDPVDVVISFLNDRAGRMFRSTDANRKEIKARMKKGARVEDCKLVIDWKVSQWGDNSEFARNLNPTTLFRPSNFDRYLDEAREELVKRGADAESIKSLYREAGAHSPFAEPEWDASHSYYGDRVQGV